jgi:trehalose 6-phosphate phosphatase
LITDIDGTISGIAPRPEDAYVSETTRAVLTRLGGLLDTTAVISAREESVARSMVGVSDLTYIGNYGLDDQSASRVDGARLAKARERAAEEIGDMPCVRLEDKGVSFALHYRGCEDADGTRTQLLSLLQPLAAAAGGRLLEGKQVVEMVPADLPGKDSAVANLATARGLKGIVYLGDDVSDIAAFREIARRRRDGFPGLAVAVVDSETKEEVRSSADIVLLGVGEAEDFLAAIADRQEEGAPP